MILGGIYQVLEHSPVRVVYGPGLLREVGSLAKLEGASRVLLVTDPGLKAAGHAGMALRLMEEAGLRVAVFDGVRENPTTSHVEEGVKKAALSGADFIVGLGGGSAMDCAKGINLILTNGGMVADYWGINKATKPHLPMILIPTTSGTGSEAQSFALISDASTHQKMACGDRRLPGDGGLRPRVAILDPELTRSAPRSVAAAAGIDAVAHAIETAGSKAQTLQSLECSQQAWALLEPAFPRALLKPDDQSAHAQMLLGAHLAGIAIELSMLGAAHACANPLTARCGITHGIAVGLMLPHVIRFNAASGTNPYASICHSASELANRVEEFQSSAALPGHLRDCGVSGDLLPVLAAEAVQQWTAGFNPRPVNAECLLHLYRAAW